MFDCGFWWPSLVNWYAGPRWIGWTPGRPTHVPPGRPRAGPAPRPLPPVRQIFKVPTSVVQNRQLITAEMVSHIPATEASRIEQPPFEPLPRTTSQGNSAAAAGAHVPTVAVGSRLGFTRGTVPASILMGRDAARESSLLARHGFHSDREPLRAAQGTTLGGRYEVYGSRGEFRGNAATSGGVEWPRWGLRGWRWPHYSKRIRRARARRGVPWIKRGRLQRWRQLFRRRWRTLERRRWRNGFWWQRLRRQRAGRWRWGWWRASLIPGADQHSGHLPPLTCPTPAEENAGAGHAPPQGGRGLES